MTAVAWSTDSGWRLTDNGWPVTAGSWPATARPGAYASLSKEKTETVGVLQERPAPCPQRGSDGRTGGGGGGVEITPFLALPLLYAMALPCPCLSPLLHPNMEPWWSGPRRDPSPLPLPRRFPDVPPLPREHAQHVRRGSVVRSMDINGLWGRAAYDRDAHVP